MILRLMRMCVWNSLRVLFHCSHFDKKKISFRVIKYHVNTTRNEMPKHFHQNIGSFWYAAEMERHLKRICFHAGLELSYQFGFNSPMWTYSDILQVPSLNFKSSDIPQDVWQALESDICSRDSVISAC